jgi:non-specific serine/threonine protein kinase
MLETVREYALERLAASEEGEEAAARQRHAAWVLAFAERVELAPYGRIWLGRWGTEHGNARAALEWFERAGDVEAVLRLAGAMRAYWLFAGRWSEGRGWLERALAAAAAVPAAARAKGLLAAGFLTHYQGDGARALPWLDEALALFDALGDVRWGAFARSCRGIAAEDVGDYARARADLGAALAAFRANGHEDQVPWCLLHLGIVAYGEGDLAAAAALGEEAWATARRLGDEEVSATVALHLAHVACAREDPAGAAAWFRIVLQEPDWSSTPESLARALAGVALLAAACAERERVARLFGAAEARRAEVGFALALPERAVYEQAARDARTGLGEEAFAAAWAAGRDAGRAATLADVEAVLLAAGGANDSAVAPPPAAAAPPPSLCPPASGRSSPSSPSGSPTARSPRPSASAPAPSAATSPAFSTSSGSTTGGRPRPSPPASTSPEPPHRGGQASRDRGR